jgi:molybdopterin converting factor small subunit
MTITVRYKTQVKRAAGIAGEVVDVDGGSLQQLLQHLAARHGDAFRQLLVRDDGALQESILVFVGERQVVASSAIPLRDGDVVTLLAPMAGG